MKKIFVVIVFITQVIISGCQVDTFHYYKDEVAELARDPKTRKIHNNENNIKDLSGCQFLYEQKWVYNERWKSWHPDQHWFDGKIVHGKGIAVDLDDWLSIKVLKSSSNHPIYIGPWHHSPHINKTIRFFAYYPKQGGEIQYQYESQTFDNKNIPEKKFSLSPTAKYAPDHFGLCVVKWTARFGYNAIAEVEYKGFFNKIFRLNPTPTGKIIEVKE